MLFNNFTQNIIILYIACGVALIAHTSIECYRSEVVIIIHVSIVTIMIMD